MKSKTSFFSRTLFYSLLKRFWPLFAAYLAIWALILPTQLNNALWFAAENGTRDVALTSAGTIMRTSLYGGAILSAGFAILFVMAAMHYLYNARNVSMMGSLPVRREGVFFSFFSAGMAVMLVSNLLVFGAAAIINASYGITTLSYTLQGLAMVCCMSVFFMGFAALCGSLTGNLFVLPFLYIILNFTTVVVMSLTSNIVSSLLFGYSASTGYSLTHTASDILIYLSPLFYILGCTNISDVYAGTPPDTMSSTGYFFTGWTYLIVLAAAGVLFIFAAIALVRRRRMEAAGDVIAIKSLKPVFKYCLTVGCSLVIGSGLYYIFFSYDYGSGSLSVLVLLLCLLVGAFIGYFAAQMLIEKTLKVFAARNWAGLGITALVIVVLVMALSLDLFGYERKVPDKDDVAIMDIRGAEPFGTDDPEIISKALDLHRAIVDQRTALKDADQRNAPYYTSFSVRYTLSNGSILSRDYQISEQNPELTNKVNELFNDPKVIKLRHSLPFEVTEDSIIGSYINYFDASNSEYENTDFTDEEAYELFTECILPDMSDGNIGLYQADWYSTHGEEQSKLFMEGTIHIDFYYRANNGEYYNYGYYTSPTIYSVRTNKWLEEHGIFMKTMYEAEKEVPTSATDLPAKAY